MKAASAAATAAEPVWVNSISRRRSQASASTPATRENTTTGSDAGQAHQPKRETAPLRRHEQRDVPQNRRVLHERSGERGEQAEPDETKVAMPEGNQRLRPAPTRALILLTWGSAPHPALGRLRGPEPRAAPPTPRAERLGAAARGRAVRAAVMRNENRILNEPHNGLEPVIAMRSGRSRAPGAAGRPLRGRPDPRRTASPRARRPRPRDAPSSTPR